MRLQLATDLKKRAGIPDKDARIKNGIVESRGDSTVVRKRPGFSAADASGLGLLAQGGMQFGDVLYVVNNDDVFEFSASFIFLGGYHLSTGGGMSMYSPTATYNIGDSIYYQDPDTGEVYPLYVAFYPNPGAPSTTNTKWTRNRPYYKYSYFGLDGVTYYIAQGTLNDNLTYALNAGLPYSMTRWGREIKIFGRSNIHIDADNGVYGQYDMTEILWDSANGGPNTVPNSSINWTNQPITGTAI